MSNVPLSLFRRGAFLHFLDRHICGHPVGISSTNNFRRNMMSNIYSNTLFEVKRRRKRAGLNVYTLDDLQDEH